MAARRSVLIVDRSEETREVLRCALERRGVRTVTAGRARQGLELARLHRPELVVLDLELDRNSPEHTYARFAHGLEGLEPPAHLILLGGCRLPEGAWASESFRKPYHYGPLIRRIESLLGVAKPSLARCA